MVARQLLLEGGTTMKSRNRRKLTLISLVSTFAFVALLGASSAAARYPDAPRTATRGPQAATDYQPRASATASDLSRTDGIVGGGGVLVILAFGFGYALSSKRRPGSVARWDTASSDPMSSRG
jgi:hypothetical protein